jgi:4-hydroxybutyryl-CoA dehydratase/vinylacetyl-CoA-Delta-isomerase
MHPGMEWCLEQAGEKPKVQEVNPVTLRSARDYLEGLEARKPAVYVHGERVGDISTHPATKPVVDATAAIYDLVQDPEHQDVMTVLSPLTGETVSRCLHISQSKEDLHRRAEMALLTSRNLGTCNYRCVGCDAFHAIASTTWEMDRALGTNYHERVRTFQRNAQLQDLAVSGALTDPKGDRSRRPAQQDDPDVYVRIAEKRDDGILVRGAKVHQSGALAADETLVLPGLGLRPGEEEFAVAFAVPNGAEGLTYIAQYTSFTAERMLADDLDDLGNPLYGVRETCMMVFDDVFIPWDRVFMFGEVDFAGVMVSRFARMHRMNCGGACKVGFGDLMIGAAQLAAEYSGIARASHVANKITDMIYVNETAHACAIAAAEKGSEVPKGSGVWLPDEVFGNVAKLNSAHGFYELMKLLGDVGGGMVVTMPSECELDNPETSEYVRKYLKAAPDVPVEARMRLTKFIQNWAAGLHGVGTWHGAGSPEAQRMAIYRNADLAELKDLVNDLAQIEH